MADVFSQIYIQTVFAVRNRQALIRPSWEEQLYKYMTGIVQGKGHKLIAINGMPDHIHLFIGLKPAEALSDLVREVKKASTAYVNDNKLSPFSFRWQKGYGAFSYSRAHIDRVYHYILNQKEHHRKKTFEEEFLGFVKEYGIEIGKKELFDFFLYDDE